jgi:hypothetical protein
MPPAATHASLRPGDLVEVRPAAAILATLDAGGETEGIVFMPEMLPHLGRRYRVAQLALKICYPPGNVNLKPGVVYLEDFRCDGTAHGACQAECRFFWREEWLRRVEPGDAPTEALTDGLDELTAVAAAHVRKPPAADGEEATCWSCQATQLGRASTPVPWTEPRQYLREVSCGNVSVSHFGRVVIGAVGRPVGRRLKLVDRLPTAGVDRVDGETLGLQAGERVEVRSMEEIGRTLDAGGRHRGLTFTDEMAQYCGQQFVVRRRVERIVDEVSGRMLEFKKNACITLEDVICTGDRATRVWFCRKDNYPYWREAWLRRVDPAPSRPEKAETRDD